MRIGIDARMCGKGFGLARYVEQLILHLEQISDEHEYVIFLRKENWDSFTPRKKNFVKVLADIPWYGFAEQIRFPKILYDQKIDLMHFPHFNVPLWYRKPFVVTIHDLIMFHYPRREASTRGPIVYALKDFVHRRVVTSALKRSAHILVTSEFTKHDVAKTFGTTGKKMTVTYQAPFQILKPVKSIKHILDSCNITKPYLLYVGAAYPHKNLLALLDAWKCLPPNISSSYQLVLVGKENFFYTKLQQHIQKEKLPNVIWTGFVDDHGLTELYRHASVYVFPSLYEGFGLPPLEAMQYGVPVVSSNASCLPEILQDAAFYFDPHNPSDIAQKIQTVLEDEKLRLTLQKQAQAVLSQYSWEDLAQKTKKVYQNLLTDH